MSPQESKPVLTEPDWATYVDDLLRNAVADRERLGDKPASGEADPRTPARTRPEPLSWVDYVDQLTTENDL